MHNKYIIFKIWWYELERNRNISPPAINCCSAACIPMALYVLTASSRPSSPPLSSRLLYPSYSSSPAPLFLYCRRLSGFCRASITFNGDPKTRPLLLARAASTEAQQCEEEFGGSVSQFVDVIAIGSRKDAVLDFCVDSPFLSEKSLRFW